MNRPPSAYIYHATNTLVASVERRLLHKQSGQVFQEKQSNSYNIFSFCWKAKNQHYKGVYSKRLKLVYIDNLSITDANAIFWVCPDEIDFASARS
jgi:hypothetical protein